MSARATAAKGACALLLFSALLIYRARAYAHEQFVSAGAAMFAYTRALHVSGPKRLLLNGAHLQLVSGSTRDGVAALLDALHARCRQSALTRPVSASLQARISAVIGPRLEAVLRSDDAEAGYLGCLDLGSPAPAPGALLLRVRRFLADGDLGAIGELRFVWAQRSGMITHYVAIWSEGSLALHTMFPARGDAPGADLPDIPRPDSARRSLSAQQLGEAPRLVAYQSAKGPADAAADYLAALAAAGCELRELAGAKRGIRSWLVRSATQSAALSIVDEGARGSSLVLVPLR